ncbi:hypothetical protein [Elizabethkingia anophelis]|uniref:hypothetical protein n=1 Tax=Elizabethkingia anophelis TaxID=1117645 RepID=UPI00301C61FC
MKTIYCIFSRSWILNCIAIVMLMFTLQFAVIGIINITQNGIEYYLNENLMGVLFFVMLLIFDVWILTATFLPIIKINAKGVTAYSLFLKRKISRAEIISAKLLMVKTRHSAGRSSISFEFTQQPETKSALNKGERINTFIIISKKSLKKPNSLSFGWKLLSHSKITTPEAIAFEYEPKAWQIIQENFNKQTL